MKISKKYILSLLFICELLTTRCFSESQSRPLALSDAVKLALENNFDFQNDGLDLELNESVYRSGMAPYFPRLSFEADSVHTQIDNGDNTDESSRNDHFRADISKQFSTSGGSLSLYSNVIRYDESESRYDEYFDSDYGIYSNTLGLRFQQPLLKNAGLWGDHITVRQNRLARENARFRFVQAQRRLILDVIIQYFTALKQEKLVEVALRGVEDAMVHLKNSQIKLEEGLVAQMDVSQAELQLARQQTTLIRIQQAAASQVDSLKLTLSIPLDSSLVFADAPEHIPEEISLDAAIDEALEQRLDLRILKNDIFSAEIAVTHAMNQRLPALDLLLNAESVQRSDRFGDSFRFDDDTRSIRIGFSYVLGDRTNRENWNQARIRLKKLENNLMNAGLAVEKDVRDEIRHYQALVEALKVSEKALAVAEMNFQLAGQSYQEGLTGNLDLIRSQDDLIDAGNNYYSDILDLAVAKARIIHALGRDLDPENLRLNPHSSDQSYTTQHEDNPINRHSGDNRNDE